jgi:hypothetical protein
MVNIQIFINKTNIMKKIVLLPLLLLLSVSTFSQDNSSKVEENVDITMKLESVTNMLNMSQYKIEVSNTETVIVNYYDRYIKLLPGIHRIKIEADYEAHIRIAPYTTNIEDQSTYNRIIKDGQEDINFLTGEITIRDYVEFSICDYFLEKK